MRHAVAFARSFDFALVRSLMIDPRAWDAATDDSCGSPADWQPNEDERIWYVIARAGDGALIGLYTFIPQTAVCWEIHASRVFGRSAAQALGEVFGWAFGSIPQCRRIVAAIPATNQMAIRAAARAGMQQFGRNRASFLKRGELVDQVLLGVSPV